MPKDNVSTSELLSHCYEGDGDALTLFYGKYKNLVYAAIHAWIRKYYKARSCEDDIKEIFQDVFFGFMSDRCSSLKKAHNQDRPEGLIFLIAYQATGRYFKRMGRFVRIDDRGDVASVSEKHPIDRLSVEETRKIIREFLVTLSEQENRIFAMRFGEELSYEKIASKMKLSVTCVGVMLNRIKQKARVYLTNMKEASY